MDGVDPDAHVNVGAGVVTVWSDIGCPWATLALQTLHTAATARRLHVRIDHRAFPLELFNGRPTPKPIIDAEIVAIAGLRPELGWRLWDQPESTYPVTTLPALEAVQAAKDPSVGGLLASDQLDAALRRAFYVEGRCISLLPVILEVADCCDRVDTDQLRDLLGRGVGRHAVFTDWHTARRAPIQGSPHLFTTTVPGLHNPGVTYRWTAPPGQGFPRFERYDDQWAADLLDAVTGPRPAP